MTFKKKTIRTIGLALTVGALLIGAYQLGTTQSNTIIVEKEIECVPDGYIDSTSDSFRNNYLDMRTVINYCVSENGLMPYNEDGSGYYWER